MEGPSDFYIVDGNVIEFHCSGIKRCIGQAFVVDSFTTKYTDDGEIVNLFKTSIIASQHFGTNNYYITKRFENHYIITKDGLCPLIFPIPNDAAEDIYIREHYACYSMTKDKIVAMSPLCPTPELNLIDYLSENRTYSFLLGENEGIKEYKTLKMDLSEEERGKPIEENTEFVKKWMDKWCKK